MRNEFKRNLDPATCHMSLDELRKRFPKVKAGGSLDKKTFKLRDGGGLYLEITPSGARGWRFYYPKPGTKKPGTISFGPFPAVGLSDARRLCDEAHKDLAKGKDPSTSKREVQRTAAASAADVVTFLSFTNFESPNAEGEIVVGPWWRIKMIEEKSKVSGEQKTPKTVRTVANNMRTLQRSLGARPMNEIEATEVLAILDQIAKEGSHAKKHIVAALAANIFDLAVARGVCKHNVAAPCAAGVAPHTAEKFPAVTDQLEDIGLEASEARVGLLMRRIRDYGGTTLVRKALEMMALTFPRPHNIAQMRWDHIGDDGYWTIPKHMMKTRRTHKVWLSRQAQEILDVMRPLTGRGPRVFPMNLSTMRDALQRMGYDTATEQCAHGFRSIASTLLNESEEFSGDAIELQLAHKADSAKRGDGDNAAKTNSVRGRYNAAKRIDERKRMMEWWGDYLFGLRDGNVVRLRDAA
jgi:integrase